MWHQLSLHCNAQETEHAEDMLLLAGAVSVSLQDAKDQPIFEPALGTTPVWECTDVLALFEQTVDMVSVKKFLKQHLSENIYRSIKVESIAEKDWIKESMRDWKPLCFGKQLWIFPSWQAPEVSKIDSIPADNAHANKKVSFPQTDTDAFLSADKATCILLDPGLAFGTGTHPTTRLCLEWLDANPPLNATVIDYGCGSGILGIAALKLGAQTVFAVDHDLQALKSTEMNAEKNDIPAKKIMIVLPKDLQRQLSHHRVSDQRNSHSQAKKVDLILANILAQPLVELAPTFAEHVRSGGQLVLSGILHDQIAEIEYTYSSWFSHFKMEILEEWVRISALRN